MFRLIKIDDMAVTLLYVLYGGRPYLVEGKGVCSRTSSDYRNVEEESQEMLWLWPRGRETTREEAGVIMYMQYYPIEPYAVGNQSLT